MLMDQAIKDMEDLRPSKPGGAGIDDRQPADAGRGGATECDDSGSLDEAAVVKSSRVPGRRQINKVSGRVRPVALTAHRHCHEPPMLRKDARRRSARLAAVLIGTTVGFRRAMADEAGHDGRADV